MKKRLDYITLQHEYPNRGKQLFRQMIPLQPLLQKDYGEELDCTITSMACIFGETHYGQIEAIARRYGYDGKKRGTNPLTVRRIMADFLRAHHMTGTARSGYGKVIDRQSGVYGKNVDLGGRSSIKKTKLNAAITQYNNS